MCVPYQGFPGVLLKGMKPHMSSINTSRRTGSNRRFQLLYGRYEQ